MAISPNGPSARAVERVRAAGLRAMAGDPTAEFRGSALTSGGQSVAIASPYLPSPRVAGSGGETTVASARGQADGLGLLLRYCDVELHWRGRPATALERVVFDVAEQVRCEALAPAWPGVRANLKAAFVAWDTRQRTERVGEQGVPLLLYTVTHMLRARLVGGYADQEVDDLIESTRANISPIVGEAIGQMRASVDDQQRFAVAARELAIHIAAIAGDAPVDADDRPDHLRSWPLLIDWDDLETEVSSQPTPGFGRPVVGGSVDGETDLDRLGDYVIFSRTYDRQRSGVDLYAEPVRRELRAELDAMVTAQAVSAQRLAHGLRRLLGTPHPDPWRSGYEDGMIDARQLPQLVADPGRRLIFRRQLPEVHSESVVTFLVDNSGSMKTHRYRALAVLLDTYARALDIAGVSSEILGFTTGAWNGGNALRDWRRAGSPAAPGRVGEALHLVYKDADTSYRRSRSSLAAMMRPMHFREGLDGEAIAWAHRRLLARPEPRKILVVVSDGAPMDAATTNVNRDGYLFDHLARVVDHIDRRSPVELAGLTVDEDVGALFRRSEDIDLDETLTLRTYGLLGRLFSRHR